ncbi:MAG: putative transport system ATP-binding protein [Chloroflexota bacterium]|jgi:putative ABC transport system ATP-binding protein|nr:putative transport system ATP-binding protein [Chloroflexota bacterium]
MRLIGPRLAQPLNVAHGHTVTRLGSAVHVRGLNHCYRSGRSQLEALHDVDLEIPAGGYVALTGPSGAGKSTLLSLIGGLERPQSGTLMVGQHNLRALRVDELAAYRRSTIGFIFQHFGLLDLLSARENIELAASLSASVKRRLQARDLLEEVGLLDRTEHRPGQLSGGERQRVAIARALVNDPSLILADEPTGNLDADSAMRVLDLLERVHIERGCTLLVVTHNESVAKRAEQRYRLDAGRLLP